MTQIEVQIEGRCETGDEAHGFRRVIQDFAAERAQCDRLVRTGKLDQAAQALDRACQLHEELLLTADQRNSIHRSMVRNRGFDLALLRSQLESCRLKESAAALRRKPQRTAAPPAKGA